MIHFFTHNLLFGPGMPILFILGALFLISIFFRWMLILVIPFLIFSLYFFRNPERISFADDRALISPADGKVLAIEQSENNSFEGYAQKITIFLSPLDVHVNWTPCAGTIEQMQYRPGKFLVAWAPKASDINERNDIVIRHANGQSILVRQIAGFVARRIVWWVEPGIAVERGYKYGMIRFGSRVDILLPKEVTIDLAVGQRVYGGETVIGHWE